MPSKDRVNLPYRPFFYTLDQVASLLGVEVESAKARLFLEGRSIGVPRPSQMIARNIADPEESPDWRVVDRELIRWARHTGFQVVERGYFKS